MIVQGRQATVEFSQDGEMWEPLPPFDGTALRECAPIKVAYTEPEPLTFDFTISVSRMNRFIKTLKRLTRPPGKRGTSPRRIARWRHNRKLKRK